MHYHLTMAQPYNCYENHRKELELILSDSACTQELRDVIETALRVVPLLSIVKETEIYERLRATDEVEAREELIEHFWPFAITAAWRYRNLGVSVIDLINAGRRGIVTAAYAFSTRRGRTFYVVAPKAAEEKILDKLDQCGVERVPPEELQRLLLDGDRESADDVMYFLDWMERYVLECEFGSSAEALNDPRRYRRHKTSFFDGKLELALRKLLRRKS